jgi:hypothetical protein
MCCTPRPRRLLKDPRSARFVEHFLDMWLSLRDIYATSPDKKLYPEFMPWMAEAMLMESRAFFSELLTGDLPITNLVQSDFAMINEPLGPPLWHPRRLRLGRAQGHAARRAAIAAAC